LKSKSIAQLNFIIALILLVITPTEIWPPPPKFFPAIKDYDEAKESEIDPDNNVNAQPEGYLKIYIPERFGRIMEKHIRRMHVLGNFEKFGLDDFDHGHIIFRQGFNNRASGLDAWLDQAESILYHTQELNDAWKIQDKEGIPIPERKARSIIGYLDGTIRPANAAYDLSELTPEALQLFETAGTVCAMHIYDYHGLYAKIMNSEIFYFNEKYFPDNLLEVREYPRGRFLLENGKRFDIFIRLYALNK